MAPQGKVELMVKAQTLENLFLVVSSRAVLAVGKALRGPREDLSQSRCQVCGG